jgi:hypothetical protein
MPRAVVMPPMTVAVVDLRQRRAVVEDVLTRTVELVENASAVGNAGFGASGPNHACHGGCTRQTEHSGQK